MINQPIPIPFEAFLPAQQFASACKSQYAWRGQFDQAKIARDITSGKLAEEMTYRTLKNLYPSLSPPDYQIIPAAKKIITRT